MRAPVEQDFSCSLLFANCFLDKFFWRWLLSQFRFFFSVFRSRLRLFFPESSFLVVQNSWWTWEVTFLEQGGDELIGSDAVTTEDAH